MHFFSLPIMFLTGISGLYLGVVGFRQYTSTTRTAGKVSTLQVIKIAVCLGSSSSLVLSTIIIFGGVLDENYIWSLQKLGGVAFVALFLGVIVTAGTAYQIYTTVAYRDMLIRKYKTDDKSDKSESHHIEEK